MSALITSGGQQQARRVALTMVQALIEFDEAALANLFAARVVHVPDGRATTRHELIEGCLTKARSLSYQPDVSAEDLVDIDAVTPEPLRVHHDASTLPPGLHETDIVVALPARDGAARLWRRIPCITRLYVRPGASPRIIGLGR